MKLEILQAAQVSREAMLMKGMDANLVFQE